MDNLKKTIAENISFLRRQKGMTQLQLAEKLNYSDKAVSKWESGASVPDVGVLLEISHLFGVSVDYLLTEEHTESKEEQSVFSDDADYAKNRRRFVITLMSACLVFAVATVLFVIMNIIGGMTRVWLLYVAAVPVASITVLVLNSIWGNRRYNYAIISVLIWSVITLLFLVFSGDGMWRIFLIGIPAQIITLLWAGMTKNGGEPAKVSEDSVTGDNQSDDVD